MRSLAYAIVVATTIVAVFLSDLLIRPDQPSVAEGWDLTGTIIVVLGLAGLVHEHYRAHAPAERER